MNSPDRPGEFTAVYEVLGPLGLERAQASVRISVREVDEATNAPPVPRTVTARVIAGETVRIRIPVEGMDPDGDSVQLIGQETAPSKGTVVETGQDVLEYEAGVYSSGTDTFRYTVVDALGARASGLIRVGISQRLEGARNPVANDDQVTVRTGVSVLVTVLENDAAAVRIGDGDPLWVAGVGSVWAEAADVEAARAPLPPGAPRLWVMHNPEAFRRIPAGEAPLALAAHTHGGQIRILGPEESWLDIVRPGETVADGWASDEIGQAGNRLYVNRGIGFSGIPARVRCRPELTLVTLRPSGGTLPDRGP